MFLEELRRSGQFSEELREQYGAVFRAFAAPRLQEAPAGWFEDALALLAGRPVVRPAREADGGLSLAGRVREALRGVLVLDSARDALAVAVRSAAPLAPRQMLYAFSIGRLFLEVTQEGSGYQVRGQFVPLPGDAVPDLRGATIVDSVREHHLDVDETGRFAFEAESKGSIQLSVSWGEAALAIDPISL